MLGISQVRKLEGAGEKKRVSFMRRHERVQLMKNGVYHRITPIVLRVESKQVSAPPCDARLEQYGKLLQVGRALILNE